MTSVPPMMLCGHAANAVGPDGAPSCAICIMLDPGATVVDSNPPDFSGRQMLCSYRVKRNGDNHVPVPSDPSRAFFEHKPDEEYDRYYCGCWGWD